MPTHRLSYSDPFGTGVPRPYLVLYVTGPNGKSGAIPGVIDSGADMTCLPLGYASLMGYEAGSNLTLADGHQASGKMQVWAAESTTCEAHVVGLTDHVFELRPSFVEGNEIPLWGRGDFFLAFQPTFDEVAQEFSLTPCMAAEA